MKAKVSIFSDKKQTVTVDEKGVKFLSKEAKEKYSGKVQKETSIAERTLFVAEHEVKGNLPLGKKLAILEHFVMQLIGIQIASMLKLGKRFPSKVFFRMEIGGQVYSSKTALTKAQMLSDVAINLRKLVDKETGAQLSRREIIDVVSSHQKTIVREAMEKMKDVDEAARSADKLAAKLTSQQEKIDTDYSLMSVDKSGNIETVPVTDAVGENQN